jgi:uncharacterized iron-regulated protein
MREVLGVVLVMVSWTAVAGELDLLPIGNPKLATQIGSAYEGEFYDSRRDRPLPLEELARELVQARVVLLGEDHTDIAQKAFHARLLEAMAEAKADLILGMEFFLRSDRETLEDWHRGELDGEEFLRRVSWYDRGGYRWEYYRPVMEVARSRGIPVVGLNVPREIPRAVNRGGLDGLTDEQRLEVGEVVTENSPEHRYLIARYFGETVAMLPPGWFDNMYKAQCLWDVVMARSILEELDDEATVVVIVGSGHVAYELGISRRLAEELEAAGRAEIPVATLCPVVAPPPDPDGEPAGHPMGDHGAGMTADRGKPARFVRSLAHFIGVFADDGGIEAFPRVGLRLSEQEGGAVVSMAWPDTPAEAAGFMSGDLIVNVNGVRPENLSDLRMMLSRIQWRERVGFLIEREGEQREIALLLYPAVDLTEEEVAPGWSVAPAASFDPAGILPVTESDESARTRHSIVAEDGVPQWVELRSGDVLDEVHELDEAGLVIRSLFRLPQEDGAVEIRYARSDDGAIAAVVRFDREGRELS